MPNEAQSYSPSQVIVSTGKIGTGFIRINANPNDQTTPYIDIVERTGSGIYDVKLKARLGDLSGLADSSYVFGNSNPGFGLATDNVFLQGGIIANTGSIGGISMQSGKLFTGTGIFNNNNTGFYLDNASYFSLGNKLSWDGITLSVSGTLNATDGNIGGFAITRNAITGSAFYLSGSAANNGTSFFLSSSRFNIKGNGDVTGSQVLFTGGRIGGFTISSDTLSNSTNFFISGAAANNGTSFFISSSRFNIKGNGNITGSQVLFTGGKIGGFNITTSSIEDVNGDLYIKSSGQITGSSVRILDSVNNYAQIDTATGYVDGYNIARQIYYNSGPLITSSSTNTGGTTYQAIPSAGSWSDLASGSTWLLPGETQMYFAASGRIRTNQGATNSQESGSLNMRLIVYAPNDTDDWMTSFTNGTAYNSVGWHEEWYPTGGSSIHRTFNHVYWTYLNIGRGIVITETTWHQRGQSLDISALSPGIVRWKLQYYFWNGASTTAPTRAWISDVSILTGAGFVQALTQPPIGEK
jgi:hypothetical protein